MKSKPVRRVLSLLLVVALFACGSAFAENYSALFEDAGTLYATADFSDSDAGMDVVAGTVVTVTGEKGGVARVRYESRTLYTSLDALTKVEDIAIPATALTNTYVFSEPRTTASYTALKQGTAVNVLLTSGKWAYVERNGMTGYALKDQLKAEESAAPEQETDPFSDTAEKTPATSVNGVTVENVSATVIVSSLPVYKTASTGSKKLTSLKQGTTVTVSAYNKSWACITLPGSTSYGFCALKGLERGETLPDADDSEEGSNAIPAVVIAKSAKVYASNSTGSKKLGTIKQDQQVNVLKTSGSWAYIELDGNYGYCALKALKKVGAADDDDDDPAVAEGTCTVVTPGARIYASASTSAASDEVSVGTTFNYFKANNTWVAVDYEGDTGYILKNCLSADSYAELSAEDSGTAVKALNAALLKLGYLDDVVDSSFTGETEKAVSRLQEACGMTASGIADVGTLRLIYGGNVPASPLLSASLTSKSSGANVTRIQTRLYALEYLGKESSIDGSYGTTTSKAIALFQKACGASNPTGNADNATIRALYSEKAPELPEKASAADEESAAPAIDDDTPSVPSSGAGTTTTTTTMPASLKSTTSSISSGASNKKKVEYIIYNAQQQLGKRYVFGTAGTSTFDCSGLILYCFKKIGVSLPHSAKSQGYNDKYAKVSSISSLKRGDLVFFNTVSDSDQCDHVGIFLGKNNFIHASSGAGKTVVSYIGSGYYNRVFSWGRKYLPY